MQSFDQVWTTVRDNHWDPSLGGLDWEAIKAELRPRVEQASTMAEARAVMEEMIHRLKQSHFGIIPAAAYREQEEAKAGESADQPSKGEQGVIGVSMRIIEGQAVVTRVLPGLPAEQAGVQPGWVVAEINGKKVDRILRAMGKAFEGQTLKPAMISTAIEQALAARSGKTVNVVFLDGKKRRVRKQLTAVPPPGRPTQFGNLPVFTIYFETRQLPSNITYIAFNAWFDPEQVIGGVRDALEAHPDADGVILDLRGNPGGIGAMAMGVAGFFVDEPGTKLGTMSMRGSTMAFVINPRPTTYDGPLAVLVDERSMSTSEILAGGLQDLKRARVFGQRSPGAALPSMVEKLPNGDRFQYAFADYVSTCGQPLEGRGVEPDETVELTRQALLSGEDPVIAAAVRWIAGQKKTQLQNRS